MPTKDIPSYQEKDSQIGVTEEEGRYWWDKVLSDDTKKKFIKQFVREIGGDKRVQDYYIIKDAKYDQLTDTIKRRFKIWLHEKPSKELSAKKGLKLVGNSHENGGIAGIIIETQQPIEVEGGELIINKRSMKIRDKISCTGTPEGIASRLNELEGNGIKLSDEPGECHLKKEIMEKGKKVKSHLDLYKEDDEFISIDVDGSKQTLRDFLYTNREYYNTYPKSKDIEKIRELKSGESVSLNVEEEVGKASGIITITMIDKAEKGKKISKHISDKKMSEIERKVIKNSELKDEDKANCGKKIYGKGGYAGLTSQQVWNDKWGKDERNHFLYDHVDQTGIKTERERMDVSEKKYDELSENVKQALAAHRMMGQYGNGGKFQDVYYRINELREFTILEFLEREDFSEEKAVHFGDLKIYHASQGLMEFLDLYGIYYTVYETHKELEEYLESLLPKKIRNKIPKEK